MRVLTVTDPGGISKRLARYTGDLAFDIGANCGQTVERLLPNFQRIVAVEPAVESYEVLASRYGDDERVTLLQAACTDQTRPVTLSVRDAIDTGQLTTGEPGLLGWGVSHGNRKVDGITVDDLTRIHDTPDLLKIDVEGHETLVLRGAERTLAEHPSVFIEIHSAHNGQSCAEILHEAGYSNVEHVDHFGYEPGSWGAKNHYWLVA